MVSGYARRSRLASRQKPGVIFLTASLSERDHKERLARVIADFMRIDILIDVIRPPRWKHNLNATRERMAVRLEAGGGRS